MWNVVGPEYMNVHMIYPPHQKAVYDIIEASRKDDNIIRVVIFGSSVTEHCQPGSDVDVYFVAKDENKPLPAVDSYVAFDKWSNFTSNLELIEQINNTGVIVYMR